MATDRNAKRKNQDKNDNEVSSISRFFLPAKRNRPTPAIEEKEENTPNNDNVIDLMDDDDDDDADDTSGPKENKSSSPAETSIPKAKIESPATTISPADSETILQHHDKDTVHSESAETTETDPLEEHLETEKTAESVNPFAQFAFSGGSSINKPVIFTSTSHLKTQSTLPKPLSKSTTKNNQSKSKSNSCKDNSWIRMKDIPKDEQERIVRKWHGLIDPEASLPDKRFQVLVAARIHARCQDGPVRKAMKELRRFFRDNTSSKTLSVESMAALQDPQVLVPCICNLQYHNTKANHLVKAAQEIKSRFRGEIPEDEHSLKQLTGIGPVLADLLAFVNTKARHREYLVEY